jgi:hypothetical protein
MKSASDKAHAIQMAKDPAYQAWYYNTMRTRDERHKEYVRLMLSKAPTKP